VGVWDQIRDALSAVWADVHSPTAEARTQLMTSLTEAWQTEQRVSIQIRQIAPEILYAQFRQRLEAMVRNDEQHAHLLQERLKDFGVMMGERILPREGSANNLPSSPWRRVLRVLTVKRELYERYRQEASAVDDPDLRSLLERLRDDEARDQDQLIEMLVQLDAHVHETIT
jgi:hypothetical protein